METVSRSAYRTPSSARPGALGKLAHHLVPIQGHAMAGVIADVEADVVLASQGIVNAEADRLRRRLTVLADRAVAATKRERAYDSHQLVIDLAAGLRRLDELDAAQDTHRDLARGDVQRSAALDRQVVGGIDRLICGACRAAGPAQDGTETRPCQRTLRHEGPHVFGVIAMSQEMQP